MNLHTNASARKLLKNPFECSCARCNSVLELNKKRALGDKTVKNLRLLARKFDLDQSERKCAQVLAASCVSLWPGISTRHFEFAISLGWHSKHRFPNSLPTQHKKLIDFIHCLFWAPRRIHRIPVRHLISSSYHRESKWELLFSGLLMSSFIKNPDTLIANELCACVAAVHFTHALEWRQGPAKNK